MIRVGKHIERYRIQSGGEQDARGLFKYNAQKGTDNHQQDYQLVIIPIRRLKSEFKFDDLVQEQQNVIEEVLFVDTKNQPFLVLAINPKKFKKSLDKTTKINFKEWRKFMMLAIECLALMKKFNFPRRKISLRQLIQIQSSPSTRNTKFSFITLRGIMDQMVDRDEQFQENEIEMLSDFNDSLLSNMENHMIKQELEGFITNLVIRRSNIKAYDLLHRLIEHQIKSDSYKINMRYQQDPMIKIMDRKTEEWIEIDTHDKIYFEAKGKTQLTIPELFLILFLKDQTIIQLKNIKKISILDTRYKENIFITFIKKGEKEQQSENKSFNNQGCSLTSIKPSSTILNQIYQKIKILQYGQQLIRNSNSCLEIRHQLSFMKLKGYIQQIIRWQEKKRKISPRLERILSSLKSFLKAMQEFFNQPKEDQLLNLDKLRQNFEKQWNQQLNNRYPLQLDNIFSFMGIKFFPNRDQYFDIFSSYQLWHLLFSTLTTIYTILDHRAEYQTDTPQSEQYYFKKSLELKDIQASISIAITHKIPTMTLKEWIDQQKFSPKKLVSIFHQILNKLTQLHEYDLFILKGLPQKILIHVMALSLEVSQIDQIKDHFQERNQDYLSLIQQIKKIVQYCFQNQRNRFVFDKLQIIKIKLKENRIEYKEASDLISLVLQQLDKRCTQIRSRGEIQVRILDYSSIQSLTSDESSFEQIHQQHMSQQNQFNNDLSGQIQVNIPSPPASITQEHGDISILQD